VEAAVKRASAQGRRDGVRVLVLSSLFPTDEVPNRGIFIKEQLRHIKKQCHVVGVISPKPWKPLVSWKRGKEKKGYLATEERWDGVTIYHLTYFMIPKLTVYLNWLFYFWSVYRWIRRQRWSEQFDILHVHFAYPDGLAGVLLGKWLQKTVILTVRGSDINYFPKHVVLRALIKHTLRAVTGVIAVSDDLQHKVVALGLPREKVKVIPNGVDLDLCRPLPKAITRAKLGLENWSHIILYVGSLEAVKGIAYLLRAFQEGVELELGRETLLVMIGQGSWQGRVQRLLHELDIVDRVLWKSYVPHEEIPIWMNASDVLCLTSLSEGRPNVLYEAMACGRPVVASNVGGVSEVVCSHELGEVVPAGNAHEVQAAMVRVLRKTWDPHTIRRYALEHSSAFYAAQVVETYEQWSNIAQHDEETTPAMQLSQSLSSR
jgi:teichuronic acid biosynthesis glycosyltransferase TuaC